MATKLVGAGMRLAAAVIVIVIDRIAEALDDELFFTTGDFAR